eukprot:SAG31_NODE_3527_length_4155_cov_2.415927_3_plen_622_part_00
MRHTWPSTYAPMRHGPRMPARRLMMVRYSEMAQLLLVFAGGTPMLLQADSVREQLRRCSAQLDDPAYERSTLLVAQQFDVAILSDTTNEEAIARSYGAFYRHGENVTAADTAAARALPIMERQASASTVQRALNQCLVLVADRDAARPPTRALTARSAISLAPGSAYFRTAEDDRPYFPFGWNQGPAMNGSLNSEFKIELACADCAPSHVYAQQPHQRQLNHRNWFFNNTVDVIRSTVQAGLQPILFLGHGRAASNHAPTSQAMPAWALEQYPGLDDSGDTHFCSYDIDNPGAKAAWTATLGALMPVIFSEAMPPTVRQHLLVSLANEPGFYSANSSYTLPKFEVFLRARYDGDISALNAAWGDQLKGFHDHELRDRMKAVPQLTPVQHLDWGQFNAKRVAEWFVWLCGAAKSAASHAGRVKCLVKASNGEAPLGLGRGSGIDRLQLSAKLDLNGCDTRAEFVAAQSHQPFSQLPTSAEEVRAVTFSFLCPLLEKCGTFIARCNALIEKVSPCIGVRHGLGGHDGIVRFHGIHRSTESRRRLRVARGEHREFSQQQYSAAIHAHGAVDGSCAWAGGDSDLDVGARWLERGCEDRSGVWWRRFRVQFVDTTAAGGRLHPCVA